MAALILDKFLGSFARNVSVNEIISIELKLFITNTGVNYFDK